MQGNAAIRRNGNAKPGPFLARIPSVAFAARGQLSRIMSFLTKATWTCFGIARIGNRFARLAIIVKPLRKTGVLEGETLIQRGTLKISPEGAGTVCGVLRGMFRKLEVIE